VTGEDATTVATGRAEETIVPARPSRLGAACVVAVALAVPFPMAGASTPAEVELTISNAGFRPSELKVRRGETLRVRLVTADREHCLAIDGLRVEKRVVPGKRTLLELSPDRSGTFPIHCCLEPENQALRGRLIVSE
jgi:heme/copper-type cytochrome/quinol oxidase subunit 2